METPLKVLVDLYFEDIPYSAEVVQAREKIEAALSAELERKLAEKTKSEALEDLLTQYGRLSALAVLAGYPPDAAERWRAPGTATGLKPLKAELRRQRHKIYGISLLVVGIFPQILWFSYLLFTRPLFSFFNLAYMSVLFAGAFLLFRSVKRCSDLHSAEKYDSSAYVYLRGLSDKYAKRRLTGIALLCAATALFLFSGALFYFSGNSKTAELVESIFANSILVEVPLYLCIKNFLCFELVYRKIGLPKKEAYRRHLRGMALFSALYWLAVLLSSVFLRNAFDYPANLLLAGILLFAILMLAYNLTLRKKVTFKNIVFNRPKIALFTAAALLLSCYSWLQRDTWYTQPYINSVPVVKQNEHRIDYNEQTGVYTITSATDDFKILHLTDIHLGGSLYSYTKDIKALKACFAELEHTRPDLVIVTGDLCFPLGVMSLSLNNFAPVNQFAAFMRNTGVPWAFTYGNHDTEGIAAMSKTDLNEAYKALSYKTSGNLLYPYVQPAVTGRNNQLIELRNGDGTLNTALFLIDSNAYTGEGLNVYDYIHDDQVDWYAGEIARLNAQENRTVASLAFFHIPLQQYRTAYELYEQGSDEVTWFFGENNEKMLDKVCCSDYPSSLFDKILELGSTTGLFCGHDHYNNMSLEYKGIRLTYGMSIDYLAMPGIENDTAQRGAELITIHADSSWDLEQIPLTSIEH